ncbi:hypothetical protein CDD82_4419 [Ophiocordyceps australis]|uniref:TAP42-like protein n=1 Tax=Ophiocordyceps australis TaxID=1399860 RepID=A0A2C5ZTX4_9HYPO|nr:hypothetical protein CDD82_4419 [Ophiocordyceps australis]
MASSGDASLEALVRQADDGRKQLLDAPGRQGSKADFDALVALYGQAREAVAREGLLSLNEDVDDVATAALPYLLLDFRVGEVQQRSPVESPSQRKAALSSSRAAYERFLDLVSLHGLVTGAYAKLLERYRDDATRFALVPARADAAAQRQGKIAASRAQRHLEAKLEALRADAAFAERADDELVREVNLTAVSSAVHATFDALDSLNREIAVLALAPADHADSEPDSPHAPPSQDSCLDVPFVAAAPRRPGGPLLSRTGKPLQPFTLLASRADMARAVFRPGHNLPTMSIDDYLAEEHRRGNVLQGGTELPRPAPDDDDMDAADRETYKARQWDDFKDDNPRGSGNTLNMG